MTRLRNFFITGLIIFVPVVATIYILWISFIFLDGILKPLVVIAIGREIPGLSLAVTVLLVLGIGVFATAAIGRRMVETFEKSLLRIPIVSWIYSIIKQASEALLIKNSNTKHVVLIEYPRKGVYSIGFTTGATIPEIQHKTSEHVINVFIPSIPNPTTGFYIMVPEKEVIFLDLTAEEAFKTIFSGGLVDFGREKYQNENS